MVRPRKTVSTDAPADRAQGASCVFARRSSGERDALTSDAIAADIEAFRRVGGAIEIMGTTNTLLKIGRVSAATSSPAKTRR
jgi:hypothetical protein